MPPFEIEDDSSRAPSPVDVTHDPSVVPYGQIRGEGFMNRPPVVAPSFEQLNAAHPGGLPPPGRPREVSPSRERQRYEDHPTIAEMPKDVSHLTAVKTLLASSPEERIKIIRERVPGASITEDRFGNPLAVYKGKTYHIDRPDFLNMFDVMSGVTQAAIPAAVGIGLGAIAPAASVGLPLAIGTQMAGGALSEAANRAIAGETVTPGDVLPAALFSAVPEIFPVLRGVQKTVAPRGSAEGLPVGARHYLAEQERRGLSLPRGANGEMPLDIDPYRTTGANFVGEGRPGTQTITGRVEAREADRAARVSAEVDNTLGPPPPGVETMRRNIDAVRRQEGRDPMTAALQGAPPVDLTAARNAITAEMQRYLPDDPTRAVLQGVLDAVGTSAAVDAQALQNYFRTLQRDVDFGPPNAPFRSSSDPRKDAYAFAHRQVRDVLGGIPGYNEAAGAYSNLYRQVEHFDAGRKLLSPSGTADRLGGGTLTTERAMEILADAARPGASADVVNLGEALRAGLRQELETKITRGADDLSGLRRVAGRSELDPRRELLDTAFGPGAIDRLIRAGERERGFMNTERLVAERRAQHGARGAQSGYERHFGAGDEAGRRSSLGLTDAMFPLQSTLAWAADKFKAGPVLRLSRGQNIPLISRGYTPAVADVLSSTGAPLADRAVALRRMVEKDAAINRVTQAARIPTMAVREEQTGPASEERARRPNRKAGGRIGALDHTSIAMSLIRAAEKAKKGHNTTTQSLLEQPDEAITKALAIADEALS